VTENDKNFIVELMTKYLGKKMKICIEEVSDIPTPSSGKNTFVINKCIQN
jgi:hypothetical protein